MKRSFQMILLLLVFINAFGCSSISEASPIRSGILQNKVFTNLTQSFAQTVRFDLSSAVSQGELPSISLGSAGSQVGNIGAASSYGIGQLKFMKILIGVSAAKAKTSEAVSKVIHSYLGRRMQQSRFYRFKRDNVNVATSLNEVVGQGAKSVMGSTGVNAGSVATSISLGAILLAVRNSFSGVNAGAVAAHAGNTDAANTFSYSNIAGNHVSRSRGTNEEYDEREVEHIDSKNEGVENSDGDGDEEDTKESEDNAEEEVNAEEEQR